mmetsp:Transcript_14623/g.31697  ORF Transcript_14623/g.31697 Transcript_14623/m.31697 type:complete len:374 (-) Transcript_14623:431-1552(-)
MRHDQRCHRSGVDDLPATGLQHVSRLLLATHEDTARVHTKSRVPFADRCVLRGRILVHTRVVDSDVQTAESLESLLYHRLHLKLLRHVRAASGCADALRQELLDHLLSSRQLEIDNHECRASLAERMCERTTNTLTSAGDQRHLPVEPHALEDLLAPDPTEHYILLIRRDHTWKRRRGTFIGRGHRRLRSRRHRGQCAHRHNTVVPKKGATHDADAIADWQEYLLHPRVCCNERIEIAHGNAAVVPRRVVFALLLDRAIRLSFEEGIVNHDDATIVEKARNSQRSFIICLVASLIGINKDHIESTLPPNINSFHRLNGGTDAHVNLVAVRRLIEMWLRKLLQEGVDLARHDLAIRGERLGNGERAIASKHADL